MKIIFNPVELKQKVDHSYYRKDFIQKEITNYFNFIQSKLIIFYYKVNTKYSLI